MLSQIQSHNYSTCQLFYEIAIDGGYTLESTFVYVRNIMHRWLKKKFANSKVPEKPRDFSSKGSAIQIDILTSWDEKYYTFRSVHPDTTVPGKVWTTQATLYAQESRLFIGVKNHFTALEYVDSDFKDFSIPGFVYAIRNSVTLLDGGSQFSTLKEVDSEEALEDLLCLLTAPDRNYPVIIISEASYERNILVYLYLTEINEKNYFLDGKKLHETINTISHVWLLPLAFQNRWNEIIGGEWSVFDGAIRTFNPGFSLESDEFYQHPKMVPQRIMAYDYINSEGETCIGGHAFRHILSHMIKQSNMRNGLDWKQIGCSFYFDYLRERNKGVKKESNDMAEFNRVILEENESLQEEINYYTDEIDKYEKRISDLQSELYRLRAINDNNQLVIQNLRDTTSYEVPYPSTYNELASWIEQNFDGRIYLHQRAKKGIKTADYKDIEAVCDAISCLGNYYYLMHMQQKTREEYIDELKRLHIEDLPAVSDIAASKFESQYYIEYFGKKMLLERHLKKGNSRDTRECLRIYYFWDDDMNQVVIGSLPGHLDTTQT